MAFQWKICKERKLFINQEHPGRYIQCHLLSCNFYVLVSHTGRTKVYLKNLPLTLAGKQKNTLRSTFHNYNVQLGEHARTDEVQEYCALICSLVNCGDNIEFMTSHDQV